jgi:hypothetical protein
MCSDDGSRHLDRTQVTQLAHRLLRLIPLFNSVFYDYGENRSALPERPIRPALLMARSQRRDQRNP